MFRISLHFQSAKGLNVKKQFIFVILTVAISVTCLSQTDAYAQWYGGGGYGGYGMGWGGSQGGVAGIYSGRGNLARGEGQRNALDAQAVKTLQQAKQENEKARTLHIENQQAIHSEMQKRRRQAKAQDAQDLDERLAAREREQEFLDAHRPQPLASSQFNPATASIAWPYALRAGDFDENRKSIETLFQTRSKYGPTSDTTRQVSKAVGDLKDLLRSQILKIPGSDYSEARKFLDRLAASIL
jgi:hypothetical protein